LAHSGEQLLLELNVLVAMHIFVAKQPANHVPAASAAGDVTLSTASFRAGDDTTTAAASVAGTTASGPAQRHRQQQRQRLRQRPTAAPAAMPWRPIGRRHGQRRYCQWRNCQRLGPAATGTTTARRWL